MEQGCCCWESVYIQMVLVDVTRMHIPFMTPDEALNSVSHAPVINFLAPNLVGILFRVCELLHELWRPECSFVETAAQELGGHNSDYVSHNSLSLSSLQSPRVETSATRLVLCMYVILPYSSRAENLITVQNGNIENARGKKIRIKISNQ